MQRWRSKRRHDERGDTLVEILVAIVVIGVGVVGLMGGLLTTTATSTTHRNFASLDNVLRTLDTSIQAAVDPPPASSPTPAALYRRCATSASYQLAGPLYPSSQLAGYPVSVAVIGLGSNASITASFGAYTPSAGTTSSSGAAIATFIVPSGATAGNYPLTLSAGGLSVSAGTLSVFTTPSTPVPDALAPGTTSSNSPYTLGLTVYYWTGTSFTTDSTQCVSSSTNADLQQLSLTLSDSEAGSGATDTTKVVLANTSKLSSPTETISSTTPQALGSNISFTASLTGNPTPTGTVTWSFNSGAPTNSCSGGNTSAVSAGSATCTIATAHAGTYTATGTYSGDSSWSGMASDTNSVGAVDSIVVNKAQPGMTTSGPTGSQTVGSSIQFTGTLSGLVNGIAPTGTVTWTFPNTAPAGASCSNLTNNAGPVNANGTATCTVSLALAGTYNPTASYSGDSNYLTASGSQASVTVSVKVSSTSKTTTPSSSATAGSSVTFTDTVSGVAGITPTGTVTWTFTGAPTGATCSNLVNNAGTLDANGQITCTVNSVKIGTYQPLASYAGDSDYNSSSDNSASVTVGKEVPTVVITSNPSNSGGTRHLVLTAQVAPNAGDPVPSGQISWTVTVNGSPVACSPDPGTLAKDNGNVNTASVSCTISPSSAQTTYSVQASYGGDPNYATATKTGSFSG